ncbi:MAG: hypothetical protein SGJ18_13625 [Pseudomonadota bacterium]|nr:hypothetical protein [Pseudomonadota bacterium]
MPKRQLFLLFSSLITALILGLGTRIYFSSETINSRVTKEITRLAPFLEFKVQDISLSLADGMMPQIALKISGLKLSQNDSCLHDTNWLADQIFLPLNWAALIRGKLALGKIRVHELSVSIGSYAGRYSCARPASKTLKEKGSEDTKSESPGAEKITRPQLDSQFNGLIIEKFVVTAPTKTNYVVVLRNLGIESTTPNSSLKFTGNFGMASEGVGEDGWPTLNFFGLAQDKHFKVDLLGRWREGVIEASLDYGMTEGDLFRLKSQLKHLPLANLMKTYEEYEGHTVGRFPSSMWLTCGIDYTGKISEYRQAPVVLDHCLIEGDAGNWESEKLVLDPFYGTWREPFAVKLTGLPLKSLVKFFNIDVLAGVLNEYGSLSGQLSVNSPDTLDFSGQISDLEIYFSNRGVRAHQRVPKVKMQIEKKSGRLSGIFSEFSFFQGRGDAIVSFNFDKKFQEGTVQLQAKSILFAPNVQELLVGNRLGPLEAFGKIKVSEGNFEFFKGDLGFEYIESQETKAEKIKVSLNYVENNLKSTLSAQKISLASSSKKIEYLRPMLLDKVITDPWVELRNFLVHIDGNRERLTWNKGVVYIPQEQATISSEGSWQNNFGLAGWISVDFPAMKLLRWEVSGDLNHPRILPSSQWLKELVSEKPSKKKN